MDNERDLQKKIDEARHELSDLDALRIERDHVLAQLADGRKQLTGLKAEIESSHSSLASAKTARQSFEAQKNEDLLRKEMGLNEREVSLVSRERKVADNEAALGRAHEDHLGDKKALADAVGKHSENARGVAERSALLDRRDAVLSQSEASFADRARTHAERESALDMRSEAVSGQERAVLSRSEALDRRDGKISADERNISLQKAVLDKRLADVASGEASAAASVQKNAAEASRLKDVADGLDNRDRSLGQREIAVGARESVSSSKELDLKVREKDISRRERDALNREELLKHV